MTAKVYYNSVQVATKPVVKAQVTKVVLQVLRKKDRRGAVLPQVIPVVFGDLIIP